uniref:B30.2/SPRY domain-containing protein n=1 Tax=Astyanax mexicanus TaxID=7994 RepID=A0A8B9R5I2_ASTMX
MKSNRSFEYPPLFSNGGEPSHVSMKSNRSLEYPPLFSNGGEPSHVSMKSNISLEYPPLFSNGGEPSHVSMKNDWYMRPAPFKIKPFDSWQCCTSTTLNIDSMMKRTEDLLNVFKRHKTSMKIKYEGLFEGNKTHENKAMLNQIYTELYIIEGEDDMVNEEHEVLQMQKLPRGHMHDTQIINCLDIFKAVQVVKGETKEKIIKGSTSPGLRHDEKKEDKGIKLLKLKTALTKGIAGIGKTVSVQKFVLDWAEEKANQDVDFVFVLSFRELNLIKDDQYCLHKLLCAFYPELKDLDPKIYDVFKSIFILDGLDESRIPLNFLQCEKVSDITTTSSVGGLMTNLIKGELLPSALLWITSRPAAANQIPPQYINRVTEIRGFSNPQKEEYFRKRISDQDQAEKIISHIKTARSLHIMCHIPVFCWISSTVFQRNMKQDSDTEIPTTLTEMYSHFLLTQINTKNAKYERNLEKDRKKLLESNRAMLLKLAELAFNQLMKGNVMFYEEDLRESGIDLTEASVYSGFVTEILKEECGLYQKKIYCFIHLSFQEFLAAVYVFHCYQIKNMEVLYAFEPENRKWFDDVSLEEVLEGSVNKAVKSPNGHLDLFLRFLLGISLESNQRILEGLLTLTDSSSDKTTMHIKNLIKNEGNQYSISTERSISLFLCLSEMNDQSLCREIQEYLKSEKHRLSPGQCSTIACMLLISDKVLEELDLKQYNTSQQGYQRLIPAMTVCRKALLAGCNLTRDFGETLCSLVQSTNSSLKYLDLSNNDLQDSGVELISAGLKSSHCKLQTLRLAGCKLTTKSSETICCVLQSANSSLKELDLSNNDLQNSGVKQLAAALTSQHCNLETLRLSGCMVTYEGCSSLASALISNSSYLSELDLTYNHPGESGVKLLSDLLEDPHCKLEKLQMEHGGMARMKSGLQKYAWVLTLDPNTAHTGLSLTKENRMVEGVEEDLPYPDHPDRFENWQQVLSVESLTGRCYWEVEWSEVVTIAVAYKQINRKEMSIESGFGLNKQSWSLYCHNSGYLFRVNNKETAVPVPSSPSNRVGVYLDWPAGILSFFSVSPQTPTLTHLCTIHSQFTEPLHAGFGALSGSSLWVCTESL